MPSAEFTEILFKEGKRTFIKIPFNVWEKFKQKGLIPVKVSIENYQFECRLIPKGEGIYYIPVTNKIVNQINKDKVHVSLEIINALSRINMNSPYTIDQPIRIINSIEHLSYPKDGYCGQLCLAMLTGLSVDEIIDITHMKAWQCSMSKLIEALDYFGIKHDDKITYTKGKEFVYPDCCIVNVKGEPMNHLSLYYNGTYYDSEDIDFNRIIGYLKIHVDKTS